jgi:hypothetical protein
MDLLIHILETMKDEAHHKLVGRSVECVTMTGRFIACFGTH